MGKRGKFFALWPRRKEKKHVQIYVEDQKEYDEEIDEREEKGSQLIPVSTEGGSSIPNQDTCESTTLASGSESGGISASGSLSTFSSRDEQTESLSVDGFDNTSKDRLSTKQSESGEENDTRCKSFFVAKMMESILYPEGEPRNPLPQQEKISSPSRTSSEVKEKLKCGGSGDQENPDSCWSPVENMDTFWFEDTTLNTSKEYFQAEVEPSVSPLRQGMNSIVSYPSHKDKDSIASSLTDTNKKSSNQATIVVNQIPSTLSDLSSVLPGLSTSETVEELPQTSRDAANGAEETLQPSVESTSPWCGQFCTKEDNGAREQAPGESEYKEQPLEAAAYSISNSPLLSCFTLGALENYSVVTSESVAYDDKENYKECITQETPLEKTSEIIACDDKENHNECIIQEKPLARKKKVGFSDDVILHKNISEPSNNPDSVSTEDLASDSSKLSSDDSSLLDDDSVSLDDGVYGTYEKMRMLREMRHEPMYLFRESSMGTSASVKGHLAVFDASEMIENLPLAVSTAKKAVTCFRP